MATVLPRADNAPEATCPACGAPATGYHLKSPTDHLTSSQYLCATGDHMWTINLFRVDGGAA